jgi:hypothetical protein
MTSDEKKDAVMSQMTIDGKKYDIEKILAAIQAAGDEKVTSTPMLVDALNKYEIILKSGDIEYKYSISQLVSFHLTGYKNMDTKIRSELMSIYDTFINADMRTVVCVYCERKYINDTSKWSIVHGASALFKHILFNIPVILHRMIHPDQLD